MKTLSQSISGGLLEGVVALGGIGFTPVDAPRALERLRKEVDGGSVVGLLCGSQNRHECVLEGVVLVSHPDGMLKSVLCTSLSVLTHWIMSFIDECFSWEEAYSAAVGAYARNGLYSYSIA